MKECDIFRGQNIFYPPTYFQGVKTLDPQNLHHWYKTPLFHSLSSVTWSGYWLSVMWSMTVGHRTRPVWDQKIGLGLGLKNFILFTSLLATDLFTACKTRQSRKLMISLSWLYGIRTSV